MNKVIRSKTTSKYGKIIAFTELCVIIDFYESNEPIAVPFDTFLKLCDCDEEVRRHIESLKNTNL